MSDSGNVVNMIIMLEADSLFPHAAEVAQVTMSVVLDDHTLTV